MNENKASSKHFAVTICNLIEEVTLITTLPLDYVTQPTLKPLIRSINILRDVTQCHRDKMNGRKEK